MIGIINWVIEMGRIDIAYEISVLSWYLSQPQTGHFVQALHIFKYLDINKNTSISNLTLQSLNYLILLQSTSK